MTDVDGLSAAASENARVIGLLERLGRPGPVVELVAGTAAGQSNGEPANGDLANELAASGRRHLALPVGLLADGADAAVAHIRDALGHEAIGGLVARDVVGHLGEPSSAFASLAVLTRELAGEHEGALAGKPGGAPLIVTVPNVSHRDVAIRLVFGRWDPGADDRFAASGATLFDDARLSSAARDAGFVEVDRDDQESSATRSVLELDHPAVSPATTVREFLDGLRAGADEHGTTYRFVRAYVVADAPSTPDDPPAAAPFCSVVMRTLGDRSSIHDALTSLAAQTDDDFEVVVAVHRPAAEQDDRVDVVRSIVEAYAPAFAGRVRVEEVVGGGRSAPLNRAIDVAAGRYLAILDDDDIVTADWIEQFRRAALRAPGRVVRTLSVAQAHRRVADGLVDYEPIGGFERPFARSFDLLEHRYFNQSPPCSFAVPLAGLRALGIRFDDDLDVNEDWDLLLAAASPLGVSNLEVYASVYRRFADDWSASGGIATSVWDEALDEVRTRHDRTPTLVPAGGVAPLTQLRDLLNHLLDAHPSVVAQLDSFERSRYWRLTAPLRWVTSKRRR